MKMSAEYACGQLLFNLKNSNLHYLIEETHLSAYITIRKKLIKPSSDNPNSDTINMNVDMNENVATIVKKENDALKVEINDQKTLYAMMKVEFEELEIKHESLQKDIATHDDMIEEAYSEGRTLKTSLSKSNIENSNLLQNLKDKDIEISTIKKELEKTRGKFKVLEKVNNETEEDILMLENKLASRDEQVYKLREEIKTMEDTVPTSFSILCDKCENVASTEISLKEVDNSDDNVPSTSKCGKCEFDSGDEGDLNQHIESVHVISCDLCDFKTDRDTEAEKHKLSNHSFLCKNCNLTFNSENKLSEHMCRIPILNPTSGDSYMKNYTIFEGCTRIFSTNLQREIVYLHSEQCINVKWCPDMLPYWDSDMVNFDGGDMACTHKQIFQ